METILCKNPKTGAVICEIPKTPTEALNGVFRRSREAQVLWAKTPVKKRVAKMLHLRDALCRKVDEIASVIHEENGKPVTEALVCELLPAVELLSYLAKITPEKLKDKTIPLRNPLLRHRKSILTYWPLGAVAVISPWNYPFFLAFGDIAFAIVTGNSVVFKPSEHTSRVGQKIQELFDEAGFPRDLLQTVYGEGSLGSAIIEERPAKVFFTGSVRTGKAIMKQASQHLIPVTLELGGKDAMIILPDADLDFATSAALWGGYTNSGQVCASVERLIVHESIAKPFAAKLKEKIALLSPDTDLGVTTMDRQKAVYEEHLLEAREKGAEFLCGGILSADRTRMLPTLVTGSGIEGMKIYNEETFGPVIAMTTFKSIPEAIEKTNQNAYGLLASVITNNPSLGEEVARELHVGSVMVNEVLFSAGLPETPWGGLKDSGFGRKHSELGIHEFVHVRHINKPRFGFLRFKSFWWFPYTGAQREFFRSWIRFQQGGWIERCLHLPHLLWSFVHFLKSDRRL